MSGWSPSWASQSFQPIVPSCGYLSQGLQGLIISTYGDHWLSRSTWGDPTAAQLYQLRAPHQRTPESITGLQFEATCWSLLGFPVAPLRFRNCCLPVMVCNAVMSAGMAHLAGLIEGGMSHRDAVAKVYKVWNCRGSTTKIPRSIGVQTEDCKKVLQWLQYYSMSLSLMAQLTCQVLEGHRATESDVVMLSTRVDCIHCSVNLRQIFLYLDQDDGWFINAGYFSIGPMGNICQSPTSLSKLPFLLVHLSSLPHFCFCVFLISW